MRETTMKVTAIAPWIREHVVELFRCAADICANGCDGRTGAVPLDDAAIELFGDEEHNMERTSPVYDVACAVIGDDDLDLGPCSVEQLLEAAQLVEERSWP